MPKLKPALIFLLVVFNSIGVFAQIDNGRVVEIFPYPLRKFAYISPRYDRLNLENDLFVESYYTRLLVTSKGNLHLRLDLPLGRTNATDDGSIDFGLQDIAFRFTQLLGRAENVFFGYYVRFYFPTATQESLGSGKFQADPGWGFAYFFPGLKGSVMFAVDYRFSYAGDRSRPDISVLGIAPNIDYWGKRWYIGYYPTYTYDFNKDVFDFPLDVEAGYFLTSRIVLSAEYIQPLLSNRTYENEFTLKLRFSILQK